MCNEEILKHMEEDMTFRGLTAGTIHSYIMRVKRYMKFHEGKNIEELTEDDIRDFLKYLTKDTNNAGLSTLFCTIFIRTLLNFRIYNLQC